MMRVENWDSRLVELAQRNDGRAFRWGATDCVTLTRRAVVAILGSDPFGDSLPRFKTKKGALRIMDIDAVECLLSSGAVEVGTGYAWSGDVALGPSVDAHGLPAVSVLLPQRKALVSTSGLGVSVIDRLALPEGTRFFRYG